MSKKPIRIVLYTALGIFLTVYVLVALLNSTVVQSYLGAVVGQRMSEEWGGKVRVGALHFSPFSHLIADEILLVSPTDDTLFIGDRITCRFKRFPISGKGLSLDRVLLRNCRYHLATDVRDDGRHVTNLQYIVDYFANPDRPREPKPVKFTVEVKELRLINIDYIQDLHERPGWVSPANGVDIPHMRYLGTNGCIRNVFVQGDSILARIVSFSTTEASGLRVEDLSADVAVSRHCIKATNLDLKTADSRVFLDAQLDYDGWDKMKDYCNLVDHHVYIKPGTEVNLRDAAYWAAPLWGIDITLSPQGHFSGPVSDMSAQGFVATFGEYSHIFADLSVHGLPVIANTTVGVDLHRLHAAYPDLATMRLPNDAPLPMMALLKQMGTIDLDGSVQGGLQKCEAYANLNTLVGDLEAHAALHYDSIKRDYAYNGDIDSRTLGLRSILPNEWVSRTGLHLSFQGRGNSLSDMDATIDGRLSDTWLRGEPIDRTTISAELSKQILSASIAVADSLINMDFTAVANLGDSSLMADVRLRNAHLSDLQLLKSDSSVVLTTRMRLDTRGLDLAHITGSAMLENTHLMLGKNSLELKKLRLDAQENHTGYRSIDVASDWLTGRVSGYYTYSDLPLLVRDLCDRFAPVYFNPYRGKPAEDMSQLFASTINIDFRWNDEQGTFFDFMPNVVIADGTSLIGNYNHAESMKLVLRSDSVRFNNLALHDIGFNTNTVADRYQCNIQAADASLGSSTLLENINISAIIGQSISSLALRWGEMNSDAETRNDGDLELWLSSSETDNRIMIGKHYFYLMGQQWSMDCLDGVMLNYDRVKVDDLMIHGVGQSLALSASIEQSDEDYVSAVFKDLSIDRFCDILLHSTPLNVEGKLAGEARLSSLTSNPHFDANLTAAGCAINNYPLGDLTIDANYLTGWERLYINVASKLIEDGKERSPVTCAGYIQTQGEEPFIDLNISVDSFDLKVTRSLLADFSSNIDGIANLDARIHGTTISPTIDGVLSVSDGLLQVSATGVTYYFDDSLMVNTNLLQLEGFSVRDELGNEATVDGEIVVKGDGVELDLSLVTDGITVLDKASGDNFYGHLLASAEGTIKGPVNKLDIVAMATTLNGSEITVPISNTQQVSENDYIIFEPPVRSVRPPAMPRQRQQTGGINLLLNLAVTPGVRLNLPMDFDQLTTTVTAVGRGDIQVSMRDGKTPDILGDYEFASGNFRLSLMDLVGRNFVIEDGSTLNFPGDITNARFNINAVYGQRVNLATLMGNMADNYVQVQNVIKISGTLQQPDVGFDIRLPNAEQALVDQVFSYIDKNNERDMLNQSISLLIMGQFATNGSATSSSAGDGSGVEGINSMALLTSTAGSVISSMVKVVDVNLKYQTSTTSPNGQIDVGISKQWNKFYFESTFGYGTGNTQDGTDMPEVLMGDVELGYKFNPYVHVYGFHRNNTSYYTRTELPYKQGLGIQLSKDFDNLYDLVPWLRRKSYNAPVSRNADNNKKGL